MSKKNIPYLVIYLVSFFIISCEKPTEPDDSIPANLFPINVGKSWTYAVEERDMNGNIIPGKTGTVVSKVPRSLTLAGRFCFELIDSVNIADSVGFDRNFVHIDSKGNIWFHILFESNEPGSGPGWLKMFNREIGFDNIHTAFDTIIQPPNEPYPFRIKISSLIKRKESISVPLGSFVNVYPGEMIIEFIRGNLSLRYKTSIWFVPNIGPVKFVEDIAADFGQPVMKQRIKILVNKNF